MLLNDDGRCYGLTHLRFGKILTDFPSRIAAKEIIKNFYKTQVNQLFMPQVFM